MNKSQALQMKQLEELHEKAMDLAQDAAIKQARGDTSQFRELYAEAFRLEKQAAEEFAAHFDMEITRSVLFRSAASLAMQCGDYRAAEKLIASGLAGNPPNEIADELRDLMEQVHFQRHLDLRGVTLEPNEFQVSMTGNAISFGMARSEPFLRRVESIERLFHRTADRCANEPFHKRSRGIKTLGMHTDFYLSVPRAASFAVTLRIACRGTQQVLQGISPVQDVISEMLLCIELLENAGPREIEKHIPDAKYRRNFLGLARDIAPDGDDVKSVGLTSYTDGKERRVLLTRTTERIPSYLEPPKVAMETEERVEIKGTLKYADSRRSDNTIKVVDAQRKEHTIFVPEGMMDDIVRPHWDFEVLVRGVKQRRRIVLDSITRCDSADLEGSDDGPV